MTLAELTLLGRPALHVYPPTLNLSALSIWVSVVSAIKTADVRLAWSQAITNFKAACAASGVKPFDHQSSSDLISATQRFLKAQRQKVLRFARVTSLLDGLDIFLKEETVTPVGFGFTFKVTLHCALDSNFDEKLHDHPIYRFGLLREGQAWVSRLDQATRIEVASLNRVRRTWTISYAVECPLHLNTNGLDVQTYVFRHVQRKSAGQLLRRF